MLSQIQKMAQKKHTRIGIGDGGASESVKRSVKSAQREGYTDVEVFYDAQSLVAALKTGSIEAAVRGTLEARNVLSSIKSEFGVERLQRIAFLMFEDEKLVLLAPVGVDEGRGSEEKMELIIHGCKLLTKLKVEPKVGVLSGGRMEDMGRDSTVDRTLRDGEKVTGMALNRGIEARHFGILLEEALKGSNIVMAPDGMAGNLIFRALHFFGGAQSLGAPVVNIDRVFVDTSRAKEDYVPSMVLALALSGAGSQG